MEGALTAKEIDELRSKFSTWLRWLMATRPGEFPSQAALAKALGISGAGVTYLLKGDRSPSIETALAASRLSGFPVDYMMSRPPPSSAPAPKGKKA